MQVITIPVGMLGTNCYLLCSKENSCAIIDPGAQPEKIIDEVNENNLNVKYILLTHGHHDHIGAVKRLIQEYPDIRLYIGKNDYEMLIDGKKSLAVLRHTQTDDFFIEGAHTLMDGGEILLDELKIKVLDTPGHTKGSVCYICEDAIFAGDTLFYRNVGRCDLYGGDYDVLKVSLRKLNALEGDYIVYPGHGNETSLNFERKNNPYIAEALA